MRDLAESVLMGQGHQLRVSDLYAMRSEAVADADDFHDRAEPGFLRMQSEQARAQERPTLSADIAAEQEKLLWAAMVIFQFPLW